MPYRLVANAHFMWAFRFCDEVCDDSCVVTNLFRFSRDHWVCGESNQDAVPNAFQSGASLTHSLKRSFATLGLKLKLGWKQMDTLASSIAASDDKADFRAIEFDVN
jgi:hypothetical protein